VSVSSTVVNVDAARPVVRTGVVALALLSSAHFFVDLYSSALGALQPYLVDRLNLSLTQAGILGGLLLFSASLCQPLYGYLSDRLNSRMFTVLAPAVAGLFISLLPMSPSYGVAIVLVLLGGAGVASFHPQASSRVTLGVTTARGRWMATFISSGTLGFAFGPTFFSLVLPRFGFDHAYLAAIPAILCTAFLWFALAPVPVTAATGKRLDVGALKAVGRPLTILFFLVFIRSIVQVSYAQLIPLYLHRERGLPVAHANYVLSMYLACGALGGFLGGHLADRIGGRRVIMLSMLAAVPFLALFFLAGGVLSIAGLLGGGLVLLFTIPVNVIMAQELAPGQGGTVSALMMGFAWGSAGLLFIPLAGWLSDLYSMHAVLFGFALTPLVGFFLARRLPMDHAR
jgi:FSR family fosmidomycin resistance protein-like MFS transporter